MDFTLLVLCLVLAFTVYQGYLSIKTFISMRKSLEFIKNNKQNVQIIHDYKGFAISYALLAVFMAFYTSLYFIAKLYTLGGLFAIFTVFCLVFVIDSIANRTTAFYDGGFLCYGKMLKYKNVVEVEEGSRILRGSEVKVTGETLPIYVSKKSKAVLIERLEAFKNRNKKRK